MENVNSNVLEIVIVRHYDIIILIIIIPFCIEGAEMAY